MCNGSLVSVTFLCLMLGVREWVGVGCRAPPGGSKEPIPSQLVLRMPLLPMPVELAHRHDQGGLFLTSWREREKVNTICF